MDLPGDSGLSGLAVDLDGAPVGEADLSVFDTLVAVADHDAGWHTFSPYEATLSSATLADAREDGVSGPSLPRISIDLGDDEPHDSAKRGARSKSDLAVLRTLAAGGMGRVLLAHQGSLNRQVAVKTLRLDAGKSEARALLGEAAIMGSLEHPCIIPVHALGIDDAERPVLVMKRIEGTSFSMLLAQPQHSGWGEAEDDEARLLRSVRILIQVCNAVGYAHERGVLHLDIKPGNILVGRHGEVYLVDWGLARGAEETKEGATTFAGTPAYAAPEMVRGQPLDARTDIYLLGATLHHVLTGQTRHLGETVREALEAAAKCQPVRYDEGVDADLADLASRATSRRPEDRLPSAAAFRRRLEDYLDHRASRALTAIARRRLGELERAPSVDGASLLVEVRFALDQALTQWPENAEAKEVEANLETLLAQRRKRSEQLDQLARDHDAALEADVRIRTVFVLFILGLGATCFAFLTHYLNLERTPEGMVVEALVITGVIGGVLFAARRPLLATHPNRVTAGAIITLVCTATISRMICWQAGVEVAEMVMRDLVAAIAATGILVSAVSRRFVVMVPVLFAGLAVGSLWPELAILAFSVASGVGLMLVAAVARSHARPRRAEDPS